MKIFNSAFHKSLQKNVQKEYREFITDLRKDFENGFSSDVIPQDFLKQLDDILHDEAFDHYSDKKFYWLNLVDNYILLIQLHEELLTFEDGDNEDEFISTEEELFDFWNDTEYAEEFLRFTNEENLSIIESSDRLMPFIENQIISFYSLHINQYPQYFDDPLLYKIIPEIGDGELGIVLGDQPGHSPKRLNFKNLKPDTYPSIPICTIDFDEKRVSIDLNTQKIKIENFSIETIKPIYDQPNKQFYLIPQCSEGMKYFNQHQEKIVVAIKRIKNYAPHLYETLGSFTHTIIPVNEDGIVSYSMQSLPGYSSINLFSRDSIDLMDDLLHENGHHYLNTFLNHQELINEDDDKIYYSPWRKALRPIRGIYHATFTFFWALELFGQLNKGIKLKKIPNNEFSEKEIQKIKIRFVEEFIMLNYCRADLHHAFKHKKILKAGKELYQEVYALIDEYQKDFISVVKDFEQNSKDEFKKIKDLEIHLLEMRKTYGPL